MKKEQINICIDRCKTPKKYAAYAELAGRVLLKARSDIRKKGSKSKTEFMFKKYVRSVFDAYDFLTIEENCCNFLKLSKFPYKIIKEKARKALKQHINDKFFLVEYKIQRITLRNVYRGNREDIKYYYKKHNIIRIKEIKNIFVDKYNQTI